MGIWNWVDGIELKELLPQIGTGFAAGNIFCITGGFVEMRMVECLVWRRSVNAKA